VYKVTGNTRVFDYIRGVASDCPAGASFQYGASLWDVTASNFAFLKLTARAGRGGVTGPGISGQVNLFIYINVYITYTYIIVTYAAYC